MDKDKLLKSLTILIIVIAGSVILTRYFTGGETLLEYAEENNIPVHSYEDSAE